MKNPDSCSKKIEKPRSEHSTAGGSPSWTGRPPSAHPFAVLLAAAPAFADRYDRPDDDQAARAGRLVRRLRRRPAAAVRLAAVRRLRRQLADGRHATYTDDRGPTSDDFRNDSGLSWNGEWIDTPDYGRVWRPTRVSDEWQPYLYGRWVWTNAGWAWASDEPFGWAVYHYGRWAWSPAAGWMWVPGRTWAPAWVAWRWTDGYAAWCPLGPRSAIVERPALWVVVPTRRFLEPVRHNVVPRPQRQALPLPARPGPRAGPAINIVERAIGRQVRPLAIGHAANPSSARAGSGSVDFYRPRTAPIAIQPRAVPPAQTQGQTRAAPQAAPHVGWPTGYARPPAPEEQPRAVNAHPLERRPQAQPQGQAAQAQPAAQGPKDRSARAARRAGAARAPRRNRPSNSRGPKQR